MGFKETRMHVPAGASINVTTMGDKTHITAKWHENKGWQIYGVRDFGKQRDWLTSAESISTAQWQFGQHVSQQSRGAGQPYDRLELIGPNDQVIEWWNRGDAPKEKPVYRIEGRKGPRWDWLKKDEAEWGARKSFDCFKQRQMNYDKDPCHGKEDEPRYDELVLTEWNTKTVLERWVREDGPEYKVITERWGGTSAVSMRTRKRDEAEKVYHELVNEAISRKLASVVSRMTLTEGPEDVTLKIWVNRFDVVQLVEGTEQDLDKHLSGPDAYQRFGSLVSRTVKGEIRLGQKVTYLVRRVDNQHLVALFSNF